MSEELIQRTLMCKDYPVLHFTYNVRLSKIVGKPKMLDKTYLPMGTIGRSGHFETPSLDAWLKMRAVPMTRPQAKNVVSKLGYSNTDELMLAGLGLALSDQYWLRPNGFSKTWAEVNFFENDFSKELGYVLCGDDEKTSEEYLEKLGKEPLLISSSPDAAVNGNLPKYWENADGIRRLFKTGKTSNFVLEPYNEAIVTKLCALILGDSDYVPYRWEGGDFPRVYSSCPCMVDSSHELIPAGQLFESCPRDNNKSRYEQYASILEAHGLKNVRRQLAKMLVVDHLICNWDRHWGNFGVIADSDTRELVSIAPLFDMGESLWCDRVTQQIYKQYRCRYHMPFKKKIQQQFECYVEDITWLEPLNVNEITTIVLDGISKNPYAQVTPGFKDYVSSQLERSIADINTFIRRNLAVSLNVSNDRPSPNVCNAELISNVKTSEKHPVLNNKQKTQQGRIKPGD